MSYDYAIRCKLRMEPLYQNVLVVIHDKKIVVCTHVVNESRKFDPNR